MLLAAAIFATFNDMNKSNNLSYATSPRGAVAAQATDLELQGEGMMVRRRLLNCSTCQGKGTVPRKRKLGPNSIVASKKCPDCTCPRCKGVSTKITSTFSYCMDPKYAPSKCKRCEGTGNTGIRARRRLSRGDDEKTTDSPSPSGNNPSPPRNEAPVFATNGIGREGFAQLYRQLRAQQQHHLATPASRRAFVEMTTNRGPGGNIANVNNDNRGPGGNIANVNNANPSTDSSNPSSDWSNPSSDSAKNLTRRRLVLSGDRPAADTPSPTGNNPVHSVTGISRERYQEVYRQLRAQQQHHRQNPAAFLELTTNNRGPNVNKNKKSDIHMKYSK